MGPSTGGRLQQPPGPLDVTLRPSVVRSAGTVRDDVHAVDRVLEPLPGLPVSELLSIDLSGVQIRDRTEM
jgi:hypothetical protein